MQSWVPADISAPIPFSTSSGIPVMNFRHSSLLISLTLLFSRKISVFSVALLLLRRISRRRAERSISSLQCQQDVTLLFTATWVRPWVGPSHLAHTAKGRPCKYTLCHIRRHLSKAKLTDDQPTYQAYQFTVTRHRYKAALPELRLH